MAKAVDVTETAAAESGSSIAADEAAEAGAGIRSTVRWIAGAFAGIPSLAVLASLIRAPGESGFDETHLIAGVLCAAGGAVLGILAFARVLTPLGLSDEDIDEDVMAKVPEADAVSYAQLKEEIALARTRVGNQRVYASDWTGWSEAAEAEAAEHDESVKAANAAPAESAERTESISKHREAAEDMRTEAGELKGKAKMAAAELALYEQILTSLEAFRRDAYGVQAGKDLANRYYSARAFGGLAVGLVAAGVILLALAPKPKVDEASSTPALVTVTLTSAGQAALKCSEPKLEALRVDKSTTAPLLITLPTPTCAARSVKFLTTAPKPLGTIASVTPTEAK